MALTHTNGLPYYEACRQRQHRPLLFLPVDRCSGTTLSISVLVRTPPRPIVCFHIYIYLSDAVMAILRFGLLVGLGKENPDGLFNLYRCTIPSRNRNSDG